MRNGIIRKILKRCPAHFRRDIGWCKKNLVFAKKTHGFKSLSFIQVVLSLGLMMLISKCKKLKFFPKPLALIYVKQQQKLIHNRAPEIIASARLLHVCITYQCNNDCLFCYAKKPQELFGQPMSLDDFEFLTRWARLRGWRALRFLGGEPTTHPHFKNILDIADRQKFIISISTNGLFNSENFPLTGKPRILINFSYPQDRITAEKMEIFHKNVMKAIKKGYWLTISWVIRPDDIDWNKVIDLAKRYRGHILLRFSTYLPINKKEFSTKERFQYEFKKIAKQILDISSYAYQNHVPFYFYRPFLMCMFSEHELEFLQSISPRLFYSRCEINLGGDYHLNLGLTINPDLTCYPCPSVHIKGIKITSDTTREDIKQSFNESMTELCTRPLMDSCKKCLYFANYKHQLVESNPMVLNNKKVCQGGCLRYKESFFVKDL